MITEKELLDAIQRCERDPITYGSCEKLAHYYIIYDHLFKVEEGTKETQKKAERIIVTDKSSEFLQIVDGMSSEKVWAVMDELLTTLQVVNTRLYDGVIRKLKT